MPLRVIILKFLSIICFAYCITSFYSCSKKEKINSINEVQLQDGLSAEQYFSLAVSFYYNVKYDDCERACKKSLQAQPNDAKVYDLLCGLNATQNKWQEAIAYGEKALSINPQSTQTYAPLYYAYAGAEDWKKAKKICIMSIQADPSNTAAQDNLSVTKNHLEDIRISKLIINIIIALIIVYFIFLIFKNKRYDFKKNTHSSLELVLIASSISYLLYLAFYHFSEYIWSFNIKMSADKFTPLTRGYIYEHDGIEGYVLYSLMTLNIILSFSIVQLTKLIKSKTAYVFIFSALILVSCFYFININFLPPISSPILKGSSLLLLFIVVIITTILLLTDKYLNKTILSIIVCILLLPICFISTASISVFDYSFILAPAHRILDGVPVSDIYFQYDLLLSLFAALWMKLNIDINLFQIIAQLSFFLFFIGSFLFAKKFFHNKKLPVLFLISLVIIRYYAVMDEPSALLQITPIRLDLWLIILLLVYFKGSYNWITGFFIGLLVLVHKNFGLIYLVSYYELVFTLFGIELIQALVSKRMSSATFKQLLLKHLRLNLKNGLIIIGFLITSVLLFKGFIAQSALLYQEFGIGMIAISPHSFYWYVPIILSVAFVLLLKYKHILHYRYFSSGLFIIFLAIGNSMYFFGRSHESNIINISGILIFVLFLLFDLLDREKSTAVEPILNKKNIDKNKQAPESTTNGIKFKKIIVFILPCLLILGATYFYSSRIRFKTKIQYENLKKSQYIYPLVNMPSDFSTIKKLTNNSKKVYFLSPLNDFYYYYYGNYSEVGYFNPSGAWILKSDLTDFLNKILNEDYYLVATNQSQIDNLLPNINYNNIVSENDYIVINKEKTPFILPKSTNEVTHVGYNHDLGTNCIILPPISLKSNFTIELILKPMAVGIDNAFLIGNKTNIVGPAGFLIRQNGSTQKQLLFTYGGGESLITPISFELTPDQWNYTVITVNTNTTKIFNNGILIYSAPTEFPIKNNDTNLNIGNGAAHTNNFKGLIREVKITNDSISEQVILSNTQLIKSKIN